MVTIIGYKMSKNSKGEEFCVLELQGGVEMIQAVSTGKFYAHAHRTTITSTLNEATCKELVGSKFPGVIKKIECEPYAYIVPNSKDTIMLKHTYQYLANESANIEETIFSGEIK